MSTTRNSEKNIAVLGTEPRQEICPFIMYIALLKATPELTHLKPRAQTFVVDTTRAWDF